MGISVAEWRARIGAGPHKRVAVKVASGPPAPAEFAGYIQVAAVIFAFLLVSGVEMNPGPVNGDLGEESSAGPSGHQDVFEGTLRIPMATFIQQVPREHLEVLRLGHLVKGEYREDLWPATVKRAVKDQFPTLPCRKTMQFQKTKFNKAGSKRRDSKVWTAEGYCKTKTTSCLRFSFALTHFDHTQNYVEIIVRSTPRTSLLQGSESLEWHTIVSEEWDKAQLEALKPRLKAEGVMDLFHECILAHDADKDRVPRPGPIGTLYNIKSQIRREGDNAKDEHQDFLLEKKKHQNFELFDYDTPNLFQYAWSSDKQIELLRKQAKHGTAYLDSTGGFIKNLPPVRDGEDPRPVFYAALAVKPIDGKHSVPVSQMMTTSQTAVCSVSWLQWLKYKWNKKVSGAGRLFKVVVVDDSWAFIHAVLMSFNQEKITSFLNRCYSEENREGTTTSPFWSLTVLHVCAFHALRRVRTFISKKKNPKVSKLALNAYRALLRTESLSEAENIVALIATVFGRKRKSLDVDRAVAQLEQIQEQHVSRIKERQRHDPVGESNEDPDAIPEVESNITANRSEEDELVVGKCLYQSSPYYRHFLDQVDKAACDGPDDTGNNVYYIDKFLHYLKTQHLAYLPLLNRTFVKEEVSPLTHLLTNNCVEKWFGKVKTEIFDKEKNLRRGEVLRKLLPKVDAEILSHDYPLPRKARKGTRAPNKVSKNFTTNSTAVTAAATTTTNTTTAATTVTTTTQKVQKGGSGRRRGQPSTSQAEFLYIVEDPSQEVDQWGGVRQHQILSNAPPGVQQSSSVEEPTGRKWVMERKLVPIPPHIQDRMQKQNLPQANEECLELVLDDNQVSEDQSLYVLDENEPVTVYVLDDDEDTGESGTVSGLAENQVTEGQILYLLDEDRSAPVYGLDDDDDDDDKVTGESETVFGLADNLFTEECEGDDDDDDDKVTGESETVFGLADNLVTEECEEDDEARERRIRAEAELELDRTPPHLRLSEDEKSSKRREAEILMAHILTPQCKRHLKRIIRGKVPSERLDFLQEYNLMQYSTDFGPMKHFPDLQTKLLEFTSEFEDENSHPFLFFDVLIPEAIKFASSKV